MLDKCGPESESSVPLPNLPFMRGDPIERLGRLEEEKTFMVTMLFVSHQMKLSLGQKYQIDIT